MQNGFLDRHVPTIRSLYKSQRDAMLQALAQHFPNVATPARAVAHLEHPGSPTAHREAETAKAHRG